MAKRHLKVGTEVRVIITFEDTDKIKHGIVTSMNTQDSIYARVGHNPAVFYSRQPGAKYFRVQAEG